MSEWGDMSSFGLLPQCANTIKKSTSECRSSTKQDSSHYTPRKRSLGVYRNHFVRLSIRPGSCPEQNFCTVVPRIFKLCVWIHNGKAMYRVPNLGHCDLDFDL